ncbi:hypothetical protein [Qipengyuania marisflavi]|uniref:Uncharacterized protein n=1 Tax=Qipengyuania marisflavi TaxID=2486356 RepID=A0A5S3P5E6_9SPHN|nr:hypothetical protein [Qipengyuania marisflavi]TMM48260.1 hypothetical protein FEV51_08205 [Qipengyuania marisflavi]
MLFLGGIALGIVNFIIGYGALSADLEAQLAAEGAQGGPAILIGSVIFGTVIALALWFLVSRMRIEFVKWVLIALVGYGLFSLFSNGIKAMDLIGLLASLLQAAALIFLFRPDAKAWFAAKTR